MSQVQRSQPLNVLRGLTYADRRQLLNRLLVPSYQTFFRWMGSAPDAEDATRWLVEKGIAPLDLPAPAEEAHGRLNRAPLNALGRHWSTAYGVSATRWAAIVSRPALIGLRAERGLPALLN